MREINGTDCCHARIACVFVALLN